MSSINNEVVAGIDVHKAMLAVVVARPEQNETEYLSRKFGAGRWQVKELIDWLLQLGVQRVAMESTAQYWKPIWYGLEPYFHLILAQPRSTAAPRGRKMDFADAKRIVRRLLADDLTISFVPEAEQRRWRLLTRARITAMPQITRLRNQIEGLLEDGQLKISGLLSDLLGLSGWRMLQALSKGESDPEVLAKLAHEHVHASQQQLCEALDGRMDNAHRLLLRQSLDLIDQLRKQTEELDQEIARLFEQQQDAIGRLCAMPGWPDRGISGRSGNWSAGENVRQSRKTGVVGRPVPWARRERRSIGQQPVRQRQSNTEASTNAMRMGGSAEQEESILPAISALAIRDWSAEGDYCRCPSHAPCDLEAAARGPGLYRSRLSAVSRDDPTPNAEVRKGIRSSRLLCSDKNGEHFGVGFRECELCGANSFDYLTELQKHAPEVAAEPDKWMPWSYRETLSAD